MPSYQIARNKKEADEQERAGFGYTSRKAAEKALADPKMDNWYRQQLKIFEYAALSAHKEAE